MLVVRKIERRIDGGGREEGNERELSKVAVVKTTRCAGGGFCEGVLQFLPGLLKFLVYLLCWANCARIWPNDMFIVSLYGGHLVPKANRKLRVDHWTGPEKKNC